MTSLRIGIITIALLSLFDTSWSQGDYELLLTFDDCQAIDESSHGLAINSTGIQQCVCSPAPESMAYELDGSTSFTIQDTNLVFGNAFSVTIVFRTDSDQPNQRLLSYKESCQSLQGMDITYDGSMHSITIDLYEDLGLSAQIRADLNNQSCWHSLTFVKSNTTLITYLYGREVSRNQHSNSLHIGNQGTLTIGGGPCVPSTASGFVGAIDLVSIYSDVEPIDAISSRHILSNQILTPTTVMYIGDTIVPEVIAQCVDQFMWTPTTNISATNDMAPSLFPIEDTRYVLTMTEGGCTIADSLQLLLVDPTEVNCERLILPSAFTPNGDGLNDEYFISNRFVVEELLAFEIYDRWGGKLFESKDLQQGWDGRYRGEQVMPGVYIYKIQYNCNGRTQVQTGSFAVLN